MPKRAVNGLWGRTNGEVGADSNNFGVDINLYAYDIDRRYNHKGTIEMSQFKSCIKCGKDVDLLMVRMCLQSYCYGKTLNWEEQNSLFNPLLVSMGSSVDRDHVNVITDNPPDAFSGGGGESGGGGASSSFDSDSCSSDSSSSDSSSSCDSSSSSSD